MIITFEDVAGLNKEDFENVDIIDLSKVTYFHVSFVGFLADCYKNNKFRIKYPENKILKEKLEWIEQI